MPYEKLRYDVAPTGVATIAFDDPDTRNALGDQTLDELIAPSRPPATTRPCAASCSRPRTRSVLLGRQPGRFSADVPLVHKHFGTSRFPRLFRLIGELGKPTICAANGHVLAGALGIALACDLVVAKESAQFGTPEINVGAFPFMIMALIYRNVPRKRTNELLLLGERSAPPRRASSGSSTGSCPTRSSTPRWRSGRSSSRANRR